MKIDIRATTWLRRFSGEAPQCPKCHSHDLQSFWHSAVVVGECAEPRKAVVMMADDPATVPDEDTEHLCRACMSCLYAWSEETADYR
ncbi:hypothetical protein [Streptomyces sp. NPDC054838]